MKRLMMIASVFVFAACSPKAEEAAPADTAAPAAGDTARADTTMADSMNVDSAAMDTTKKP